MMAALATVSLARDIRHQRHVSITVLKRELSGVIGADRLVTEKGSRRYKQAFYSGRLRPAAR